VTRIGRVAGMKGKVPHGDSVLPLLLVALVTLIFVASPLADLGMVSRPLVGTTMVIVVLAGLFALGGRGRLAMPVVGLGIVLLVLQASVIVFPDNRLGVVTEFADAIFFGLLCVVLLLSVFGPGPITVQRVLGAIAVYLLHAMFFAETFDIVDRFANNAFIMGTQPTPYTSPSARFFYLSTITLTSVGFGDLAPVHPIARALVMLEAVIGQIYTTVILAWMVSLAVRDHRDSG
jgi:Ion channel